MALSLAEEINATITESPSGAEIAIAALESHGVEVVFGIPGVHTLALYDALRSSGLRHVLSRHEQGVGFMADGYARATGKPGVAIVITGPGVTNIATPIGEAYTSPPMSSEPTSTTCAATCTISKTNEGSWRRSPNGTHGSCRRTRFSPRSTWRSLNS
jgi:hypothetical protein